MHPTHPEQVLAFGRADVDVDRVFPFDSHDQVIVFALSAVGCKDSNCDLVYGVSCTPSAADRL